MLVYFVSRETNLWYMLVWQAYFLWGEKVMNVDGLGVKQCDAKNKYCEPQKLASSATETDKNTRWSVTSLIHSLVVNLWSTWYDWLTNQNLYRNPTLVDRHTIWYLMRWKIIFKDKYSFSALNIYMYFSQKDKNWQDFNGFIISQIDEL